MNVLNLGEKSPVADQNTYWSQSNIKDYDLVFMDLNGLSAASDRAVDRELGLTDFKDINSIWLPGKRDVFKFLTTGGDLVVTPPRYRRVVKKYRTIDNITTGILDWIPFDIDIAIEKGQNIDANSISGDWDWYFEGRNITFYSHLPNAGRESYKDAVFSINPIVENTYDRAVAARIDATVNGDVKGHIYWLPLVEDWGYADFTTSVYERIILGNDVDSQEAAPEWVENITVPGEEEISAEVQEKESKISELESEIRTRQERLEEITEAKKLLYGNEDELEQLVPDVLEELGLEVDGEVPHHRDALIEFEEERVAIEITGLSGGVSDEKCRQLNQWVDDLKLKNPGNDLEYSGILIINPLRRKPLDERSGYLAPHLKEYMGDRGHKILTTPELFDILSEYRRGNIDTADVVELIRSEQTEIEAPKKVSADD